MKHTLPLIICLSLLLSLLAGTSAYGQSAQQSTLHSAQAITSDAPSTSLKQHSEGTVPTLRLWLTSGNAKRCARPAFQIRLGRSFSITVPQS